MDGSGTGRSTPGDAVVAAAAAFAEAEGRRPRILVAGSGPGDGDRNQRAIVTAFADLGFDVDVGPAFATPDALARHAVDADVHIVALSASTAAPLTLVPALRDALCTDGRSDIVIVVGGVQSSAEAAALVEAGATAASQPGAAVPAMAASLLAELCTRLRHPA